MVKELHIIVAVKVYVMVTIVAQAAPLLHT